MYNETDRKRLGEKKVPKVTLIAHTPNPEKIIAAAAKLCYSASEIETLMDNLTPEKIEDFLQRLSSLGHESPIEHISFTFGIEGVSRSMMAQITRHRIASFSVQSQRYVKKEHFEYITPPEIAAQPEAQKVFQQAMQAAQDYYEQLVAILKEKHLNTFLANGQDEKTAKRAAEKKAIEDARFVLPNACDTRMMVTMNARSLLNFFRLRCCNRAQWEIRYIADEMLRLVYPVAPTIFAKAGPPCLKGKCTEGKMTCGKMKEMQAFYAQLKGLKA